MTYFVIVKIKS